MGKKCWNIWCLKKWSVHDASVSVMGCFFVLGMFSGWDTYTRLAFPSCNFDATPIKVQLSKKMVFYGSTSVFPRGHKFWLSWVFFNRNIKDRDPGRLLSGLEFLEQVNNIKVTYGKRKRSQGKSTQKQKMPQWKRKSILLQLAYWEFNLLRHSLDWCILKRLYATM